MPKEKTLRDPKLKVWADLFSLKNSVGMTFRDFCAVNLPERQKYAQRIEEPLSPDGPVLSDQTREAYGWYGFALNRLADAEYFYDTAKALAVDKLECEDRSMTSSESFSKAIIERFNEERKKWQAIVSGLKERIWHGRQAEDRHTEERNITRN